VPPTTYLHEWSNRDRALAEGLLLLEAGTGPHGIPLRLALDPDNDGWFEVDEHVDYAQAAIERWRESSKGNVEPGTFPVVVDVRKR
jgi:hypothetical protein